MFIKFTPNEKFPTYTGTVFFSETEDVKQVSDAEGERMIGDFPHMFSEATPGEVKKTGVGKTTGDPGSSSSKESGDIDPTSGLSTKEKGAYQRALKKIDFGKELTDLESKAVAKVKAAQE